MPCCFAHFDPKSPRVGLAGRKLVLTAQLSWQVWGWIRPGLSYGAAINPSTNNGRSLEDTDTHAFLQCTKVLYCTFKLVQGIFSIILIHRLPSQTDVAICHSQLAAVPPGSACIKAEDQPIVLRLLFVRHGSFQNHQGMASQSPIIICKIPS